MIKSPSLLLFSFVPSESLTNEIDRCLHGLEQMFAM